MGWKPSRGYKEKDKIGLSKVSLWLLHGWAVTGKTEQGRQEAREGDSDRVVAGRCEK